MTRKLCGFVLASMFVVAGCSSGGSSSNATKSARAEPGGPSATTLPTDAAAPCKLIDVRAADVFFDERSKPQHADARTCIRRAGDAILVVSLWGNESRAFFDKYKRARQDAHGVKGVGEAANYSKSLDSLQFVKNGNVVTVEVRDPKAKANLVTPFLVTQARYAATKV